LNECEEWIVICREEHKVQELGNRIKTEEFGPDR
jgi:hypothetical protein